MVLENKVRLLFICVRNKTSILIKKVIVFFVHYIPKTTLDVLEKKNTKLGITSNDRLKLIL